METRKAIAYFLNSEIDELFEPFAAGGDVLPLGTKMVAHLPEVYPDNVILDRKIPCAIVGYEVRPNHEISYKLAVKLEGTDVWLPVDLGNVWMTEDDADVTFGVTKTEFVPDFSDKDDSAKVQSSNVVSLFGKKDA